MLLLDPGEYACSRVMFLSGKFWASAHAQASAQAGATVKRSSGLMRKIGDLLARRLSFSGPLRAGAHGGYADFTKQGYRA